VRYKGRSARAGVVDDRGATDDPSAIRGAGGRMSNVTSEPKLSDMQYRVVNTLGNGAGSTVLLIADRNRGGKRFALKVVKRQDADDDIYIDQARTEYEVAQKLKHPAIVEIYDCRTKKSWFKLAGVELLMEYVEGRTLEELLAGEGRRPDMGELVVIFLQIASALVLMHRRGVYHGDLKPGNIMLTKDGKVKLIDLGTAWIKGRDKNRIQGTPQYIAPETIESKVVDDKTDIYNFGATMYRMFTGRYANQGSPKAGEVSRSGKLVPPAQLDKRIPGILNVLIVACLEMSPERRPAGMFEVKNQLEAVAKYLGLSEADIPGSEEVED
jgi:eukaryotic-like serine/threonine-protein kinase